MDMTSDQSIAAPEFHEDILDSAAAESAAADEADPIMLMSRLLEEVLQAEQSFMQARFSTPAPVHADPVAEEMRERELVEEIVGLLHVLENAGKPDEDFAEPVAEGETLAVTESEPCAGGWQLQ